MKGKRGNRIKRVAIIAGAACVLALVVIGVALWQPWDGASGDAGTDEGTLVVDDVGVEDAGGTAPEDGDDSGEATAEEEAWPGQSKGYVGPNGEGVIKREDYASDEEYMAALIEAGEKGVDVPYDPVYTDEEQTMGYVKSMLIINFYRSCGEERAREIVAEHGGVWVSDDFAWSDIGDGLASVEAYFPDYPYENTLVPLKDELMSLQEVDSAYRDSFFENMAGEADDQSIGGYPVNDVNGSLQYYLMYSRFRQAWEVGRCSGSVEVAVFDSGIDLDHEDLAGNVSASYDAYNQTVLQGDEQDTCGHGTMVAGVVSAVANNSVGVAGCSYNAKIVPVRVNSQGRNVRWAAVESAFRFVLHLTNKPEAINMSFSGQVGTFEDAEQESRIQTLVDEVRDDYGIVCVAAVGNDSSTVEFYPAKLTGVVGVSAIDGDGAWASFSNRNETVDMCAPGVDILSTANPTYSSGSLYALDSGTSFAAPQVAAAAALLKAEHPSWSAAQVENRLFSTVRVMADSDDIDDGLQYGVGALDAAAAVGWSSAGGGGTPYWSSPSAAAWISPNLLTTYGVRDGSAGPDFLGVTNTNFDFTSGSMSSLEQYTGYTAADLQGVKGAGLAIWATSANENANPYYQNLYYNTVTGSTATQATTWMSSPTGGHGDSNGSTSYKGNVSTGATTIAGVEFDPDIIFGADRYTNWGNASPTGANSNTNIYNAIKDDASYNPVFTSSDDTNIWTQVYTMNQLANVAEDLKTDDDGNSTGKVTRYDNSDATTSAENYEKAIRGNLLYVASQIDTRPNVSKKTVAYLYAIDASGTAYFFTPTASGLLVGDDTGAGAVDPASADDNYAANNPTINMGYMGTLPFITNTFDSGQATSGTIMGVEDIYKINPTCTVSSSDTSALADVDVIIYNSTVATNLSGTQGGKNSSGVNNDYLTALSTSKVATWANAHGFTGSQIIAGDDFGTSSNQGYGTVDTSTDGMAPLLYCQRNYTADKNARTAWAYAHVYPELYGNNADATYSYWVDKVYHVNTNRVGTVVKYMTYQSDTVTYNNGVANGIESRIQVGYNWWNRTGQYDSDWNQYAYYNGSSRASYYSGDPESEEGANAIGIFAPSAL